MSRCYQAVRSTSSHERNGIEGDSFRELRFLEEVGQTPEVSQRHLARRIGVALGVANLLVRNLTTKGYIRVSQVGWKRWAYVVTPTGISRRVQLTLAYIDQFLGHYRRVRMMIGEDLGALAMNPESPYMARTNWQNSFTLRSETWRLRTSTFAIRMGLPYFWASQSKVSTRLHRGTT